MARGGKRDGAGRPAGALTKRTREVAERALSEGKAPLDIMLDNMLHFQQVALDAEAVIESMNLEQVQSLGATHEEQFKAMLAKVKQAAGLRVMAHDCARDAAPYVHAKLSAVTVKGDPENPLEMNVNIDTPTRARALAAFVAKTKVDGK